MAKPIYSLLAISLLAISLICRSADQLCLAFGATAVIGTSCKPRLSADSAGDFAGDTDTALQP